ncbi:NERD domain-containing protein [Nocardioides dongxiaopingii]|uniref:NERD domain-containing protein n=1 Tax=Nocardioides sp. S-1144 TaxID=2582905 RepID=UPI001C9E9F7C|nr:NERD domain-containing protein [Nocardioides sp. S-1144]
MATRNRDGAVRSGRPTAPREHGDEGERTAAALAELDESWSVHRDLAWPGRGDAGLDHVVVGPPGVFVIDPKAWSGRVSTTGGVLRQNGLRRDASVTAAKDVARAVGEVVGSPAIPILCFSGSVTGGRVLDGVVVTSAADVVRTLSTFGPSLDHARRDDVRRRLEQAASARAPLPEPAPLVLAAGLPELAPAPRVRSAALVPATRLRRSSLPVGSSSSTRGATRRILPRVVGGVLALAMFGILVIPAPRDWLSDRIYDLVAPDLPAVPDPVDRPDRQGTRATQATQERRQARRAARRAGADDEGVAP